MDIQKLCIHLKSGYCYKTFTISALSIEMFCEALKLGVDNLRQLDKKYNLVQKYLYYRDKYFK